MFIQICGTKMTRYDNWMGKLTRYDNWMGKMTRYDIWVGKMYKSDDGQWVKFDDYQLTTDMCTSDKNSLSSEVETLQYEIARLTRHCNDRDKMLQTKSVYIDELHKSIGDIQNRLTSSIYGHESTTFMLKCSAFVILGLVILLSIPNG